MILSFEQYQQMLEEAVAKKTAKKVVTKVVKKTAKKPTKEPGQKVGNDPKGVLHELLVGYHLRGGRHMVRHNDDANRTPKQAHDDNRAKVTPEQYKEIHRRAKAAAEDIKKRLGKKEVKDVHWTSKPGDIESSTGIKASQKQDASDIVIHHHDGTHTGVSLKVSDKSGKVPISNPGLEETTYGAGKHLQAHRKKMRKEFPELATMSVAERKNWHRNTTAANKAKIKDMNNKVLDKMAGHLHKALKGKTQEEVVEHVRKHVLKAFQTPGQQAGVGSHMRHSTHGTDGNYSHSAIDPSEHYEHILSDPKKIRVHVDKAGQGVAFSHNGKVFARHRMKFGSQSDPLGGVKGSGSDN
jgi:hypothetical protein